MSWSSWAAGVLNGIGAPVNPVNFDTLWAWSSAESGADVMRWNNPLNTTLPMFSTGNVDANSVGVKIYPTESVGVTATVRTLLNGYYPVIVDHLRRSIPRSQWQDACPNLGTWGTGCAWTIRAYGPAPGGANPIGDELVTTQAEFDALVAANPQLGALGYAARLIFALGCSYAAGHPELTVSKAVSELKAEIAALAAPASPDLSAIEAKLDRLLAELHTP